MLRIAPVFSEKNRRLRFLIAGLFAGFVLTAAATAFLAATILPRLFPDVAAMTTVHFPLAAAHAKSSGPSRPMAEIWEVAEGQAINKDKEALLSNMVIETVGSFEGVPYSGPLTGSLQFTFDYLRPDGSSIIVSLEDADPASTVETSVDSEEGIAPQTDGPQIYRQWQEVSSLQEQSLRSYKTTPRDAVAATWDDARGYALQRGLQPDQVLPTVFMHTPLGDTPAWDIEYEYHQPKSSISISPGSLLGDILSMPPSVAAYTVDGLTGEVLSTVHKAIAPTPLPRPANR